jgi:tRNA nucleotidyltransferase (CCA-adding enzyme)
MTSTENNTNGEAERSSGSPIGEDRPIGPGRSAGVPAGSERPMSDGVAILERLRLLPGGSELLELAREHAGDVELVGGAVRDILLGRTPRELDVTVASDALAFAEALARRLEGLAGADSEKGGEVTYHERFGTALVRWSAGEIDIATRRTETYAAPGALPDVAAGTPEQDLARRDFTVNAIAVALAGVQAGEVRAVAGALEDLRAGRLRVLHDASFLDDPTRILRLVRYATRLGFEIEPHTTSLVAAALECGALRTVTPSRLGTELRLAFAEPDPVAPLAELDRLGVFTAWEPGVGFDEHMARTALEILPEDGSRRLLLAGSLVLDLCDRLDQEDTEPAMRGFLHDLELPAREGDRAFGVAVSASCAIDHIDDADTTEDLLELVLNAPVESLAIAAAVRDLEDGPRSYGRRLIDEWLSQRRHISLQVTGDDLVAAGVPEGPEVGVRLEESYKLLLEERIEPGRETELRAALEARV